LSDKVQSGPIFLTGNLTDKSDASPSSIIFSYFDRNKDTYGLQGNAEENFKVVKQFRDKVKGNTVVRLQQMYKGVPIFGATQVVHIDSHGVMRVLSGTVVPKLHEQSHLNKTVTITKEDAIKIAEKDLAIDDIKYVKEPTASLNIYLHNKQAYLVYVVELNYGGKLPGRWLYFISADTGDIVHKFNNLHRESVHGTGTGVLGDEKQLNVELNSGKYFLVDSTRGATIQTFDGQNLEELPGVLWEDEDNLFNAPYDSPAVDAHYYVGVTYDYFRNIHNRDGIDGDGSDIISTVHYSTDYSNAYWDGIQMVFGDGDGDEFVPLSGGLDIVAHEFTHGVTEYTAGLIYFDEPGAINEAISDIFGTLVEFYSNRNPDWLMGEDVYTPGIAGDALRSLEDPSKYGDPDHYSKRYVGIEDNGGVHINSGIINKAAYLISEGGTHYSIEVQGIGSGKLGDIFYRALTHYLTAMSTFQHLRSATIQAAKDLYGEGQEVETVKKAFEAVGIKGPSDVEDLEVGGVYEGTFSSVGDVKWFKIDPSSVVFEQSHISIEVAGVDSLITIYPSLEQAEKGLTYFGYTDVYQYIEFPIAWEGPYYIRVVSENEGNFKLTTSAFYKNPVEFEEPEECIAEFAAKKKPTILNQLSTLRAIRDDLLSKSSAGRELVSLYYSVSSEIIDDFLTDKQFGKSLIDDLTKLSPLISELGRIANGEQPSYKISAEEYETLLHLKGIIESKVSNELKKLMDHYWTKFDLEKGDSLAPLLNQLNLSASFETDAEELLVKVKGDISSKQAQLNIRSILSKRTGLRDVSVKPLGNRHITIDDVYVVELNNPKLVDKAMKELEKWNGIVHVEPNYKVRASANDVQYQQQWSLENTGETGGTPGADIGYRNMVKQLQGKTLSNTVIAVLDTGINYELMDFKGVVDTENDFDFVNMDNDALDDHYHGTFVSGVIAAASNNGYSMTGINGHAKILPVKVLDYLGEGTVKSVALGIQYAVDRGAKVINLSLGGPFFSEIIEEQLIYAYEKGVTVIAAAGNEGIEELSYPASSKYTIAVGATDYNDVLADFSNYGFGLDIVAPGVLVPSIAPYGEVELVSGTSIAAPHISAVAGLIYSLRKNTSPNEILKLFQYNSDDLGAKGYDIYYGYGRLNASHVVSAAVNLDKVSAPSVDNVDDNDKVVTGKAQPGVEIIVKKNSSLLGKAKADNTGKFKVNIAPQKAGTVLTIYAENPYGYRSIFVTKTVLDKTAPAAPRVNIVTDKTQTVTGKTEAYAKVTVKAGSSKLGESKAGKDGNFSVKIKPQKAGTILLVTAADGAGNVSVATQTKVQDKTAPSAPKVNKVTDKHKTVTGKAEAYAKIIVKAGSKKLGESKAGKDGNFSVKIKPQKAGTILLVTAADGAGNVSVATQTKVQDKTAPSAPKVNKVTDKRKTVTGKAEAYAKIIVKAGSKKLGESKAGKDGKFSVKIKRQKAGTVLSITATDSAGNTSAATKVKVKSSRK